LFADAAFGFDGPDLLAEVAFEGAAGGAAAADGEDRLALQVFQAAGEAAVEGDDGYPATEDPGGGLEGRGRGELVEAVVAKRAEARAMTTTRRGLPAPAPAPTRNRIAASARARRPLAALVEVGGVVTDRSGRWRPGEGDQGHDGRPDRLAGGKGQHRRERERRENEGGPNNGDAPGLGGRYQAQLQAA
jgi:hypothetical protein